MIEKSHKSINDKGTDYRVNVESLETIIHL